MNTLLIKITTHLKQSRKSNGIKLGLLLAGSLLASGCQLTDVDTKKEIANQQQRPNILFILADDHRWDLIGKYHPIVKTPTLDKLADQGLSFKKAFVTTPICGASRASILTGLTERTSDYSFHRPPVSEEDMATWLQNRFCR